MNQQDQFGDFRKQQEVWAQELRKADERAEKFKEEM